MTSDGREIRLAIDRLSNGLMFMGLLALKTSGPLADISWWWISLPLYVPPLLYGIIAGIRKETHNG